MRHEGLGRKGQDCHAVGAKHSIGMVKRVELFNGTLRNWNSSPLRLEYILNLVPLLV